jgi:lipopolysaccharide export system permease protein
MIINRYIIKSVLTPLLYTIVILTGISWLSQMMKLIFLFERNIKLLDFLVLSILILPFLLHSILPFALLYSGLYAYNALKVNKELVILESNGFKRQDLIKPLLKLASIFTFLALINSSFIMPSCYGELKDQLIKFKGKFTSSLTQQGIFNSLSKNFVLYIDNKNSPKEFEGVILFDSRNHNNPSVYIATKASVEFNENTVNLKLIDGSRQSYGTAEKFDILRFDNFNINVVPDKFSKRGMHDKNMLELIIWDLLFPERFASGNIEKYIAEAHNRIVWPLMNILIPMIGVCVFIRGSFNRKNYFVQLVKSFVIAVAFICLHMLIVSFTSANIYNNIFLYLNFILGILFSCFLINKEDLPSFIAK